MRKYFSVVVLSMLVIPAFGAGRSMVGNVQSGARAIVAPVAKVGTGVNSTNTVATTETSSDTARTATDTAKVAAAQQVENAAKTTKVNRDKEKLACTSNNIGVGNTFVWASRNSNTTNYASMIEDTENPENNVCYVLVGMRSDDSRISTADIQPQYFEWGNTITCGSWIDEAKMEDRILEAKKSARTWGTIGGAVGGAGIGFGAMELFGNKALSNISGLEGLQGQKQFTMYSVEWYAAKVAEMKKKDADDHTNKYADFETKVKALAQECEANSKTQNTEAYEKCSDQYYDRKGYGKYYGLWQYCKQYITDCLKSAQSS